MKNIIEREVDGILTDILDDYKKERAIDKNDIYNQPDKNEIIAILDHLMAIVYPGFFREKSHKIYNLSHTVSTLIEDVLFHLNKQIMVVMKYTKAFSEEQEEELEEFTQNASVAFLKTIPKIREYLDTDLQELWTVIRRQGARKKLFSLIQVCMQSQCTVLHMSCFF